MKSTMEYRDKRFALVLVDIQKKFSDATDGLRENTKAHLERVNEAIRLYRDTGNPIVYVMFDGDSHGQKVEDGDSLTEGLIGPVEGDRIVHKRGMNSFRDSDLAETIRDLGCTHMLIAGMVAQYCVLATYYGAFDMDLSPYMLEGGIVATDERNAELVEELCKTMSVGEMAENSYFGGSGPRSNDP